jgi:hypothetical protein
MLDLRHAVGTIAAAPTASRALKAALAYVRERFLGAVVFEVHERSISVWAAAGGAADTAGLQRFMVRLDEASTLAFLAREAALLQGRPGESDIDRQLAKLVTGQQDAYGLSLSIAVSGQVRFILYGSEPWIDQAQAQRELEVIGEELSRTLCRLDRDDEWSRQTDTEPGRKKRSSRPRA